MQRPGYHSKPTDALFSSDRPKSTPPAPAYTPPLTSSSSLRPKQVAPSPFARIASSLRGMMRESKDPQGRGSTADADADGFAPTGRSKEGTILGFPPRLIAFFALLVFILYLTGALPFSHMHPASPLAASPHGGAAHSHLLTSHDYLNASLAEPAPFAFCPIYGPGDEVAQRRGQIPLLKTKLHMGTGARMQKVIRKALSGHPVTISVLGASVSACHGAGDDPISPKCYPSKFFQWWNDVFPHPASELTNGAMRRMDSAYFAFCNAHHLPDKTDLVIVEFDAADPNNPEWMAHYELLIRSILVRPDQPAVIALGHFSPQILVQHRFVGPEVLHNIVAQFYDVPHISVKGLLYQDYMQNPEDVRKAHYTDPILANDRGHDLIADVLISYVQSQICAGWAATMGHSFDVPAAAPDALELSPNGGQPFGGVGLRKGMIGLSPAQQNKDILNANGPYAAYHRALKVPMSRLTNHPNDLKDFREVEPFCVSANDLINPLPPSHFSGSGWSAHHPSKDNEEDKHYWYADQPMSRLRVPVKIGSGDVGIYFLQGPEDSSFGEALCWVDDNFSGGVHLHGTSEDVAAVVPTLIMIDTNVGKGSHSVECQLLGEEGKTTAPFKILGIFTT